MTSQAVPSPPKPPNVHQRAAMTLQAIKRIDSTCSAVMLLATHAGAYEQSSAGSSTKWSKRPIEGDCPTRESQIINPTKCCRRRCAVLLQQRQSQISHSQPTSSNILRSQLRRTCNSFAAGLQGRRCRDRRARRAIADGPVALHLEGTFVRPCSGEEAAR